MRLTWKDLAATILVGAIVAIYVGYLVAGEVLFLKGPRGMAVAVLVLGLVACATGGLAVGTNDLMVRIAGPLGVVVFGLGITTVILGNEWLLGATVGVTVLLWLMATTRHALRPRTPAVPAGAKPGALTR
jgi:hypothetical protein